MKSFYIYDLKNGKDEVWLIKDPEEEIEEIYCEEEEDDSGPLLLQTFIKMLVPAVISLVTYWFLCRHLYTLRGGYAMGSEIMVPPIVWYVLYKVIDYIF